MFLQSLQFKNFKNYTEGNAVFCDHINCIVGLNGSGKTNVLDAINYLSLTKSNFNSIDAQNIKNKTDFFVINGVIEKSNKSHSIHCSLKRQEKKRFTVDESEYDRLSQHIGKFPVVMIAPNDDELIRDSSETRRKFFDSMISQTDSDYLEQLIKYNHHLKQRNALLKKFSESRKVDKILLESYNFPIIQGSQYISKKRASFIKEFDPHFETSYSEIAEKKERVTIVYKSKVLSENFVQEFNNCTEKDIVTQRTNLGIHRDDYVFEINDAPLKKFGSQGQQKSFLVSLKFAQFQFTKQHLKITPILLLDDIFDKLDDNRIQKMLDIIASDQFKQIFITDAREERTMSLINNKFEPLRIFRVEENNIFDIKK